MVFALRSSRVCETRTKLTTNSELQFDQFNMRDSRNQPYERIESSPEENVDYGWSTFRARKELGWTWRKVIVFIIQLAYIPLVFWILFVADLEAMGVNGAGHFGRNLLVLGEIVLVLMDYTAKVFYIERQFMLMEIFFVLPFASLWFAAIAYFARINAAPLSWGGVMSLPVVMGGVYLNYWPEVVRARWKQQPENKGRLYTLQLFSYVRNVNYLGDILWGVGLTMVSSWKVSWIPASMLLVFVFRYIPEKESYLAKRYPNDWPAYRSRTVRLIPYLY